MSSLHVSTSGLARIATTGIVLFGLIILLLHPLENEFNPRHRMVSEYALGSYGLLLNTAALFLALGSIALALGLWQALESKPLLPIILLTTWSGGVMAAGLFNTDAEGAGETSTFGAIHTVGVAVATVALISTTFLLSRRLRREAGWRSTAFASQWWAMAMLATTVATVILANSEIGGIVQRVWIAVLVGWLGFVASRLRTTDLRSAKSSSFSAYGPPTQVGAPSKTGSFSLGLTSSFRLQGAAPLTSSSGVVLPKGRGWAV